MISTQQETKPRADLSKLLLQGSFNEILIFDADKQRFVEANRSVRINLQYTLQELKQLGLEHVFVDDNGRSLDPIKSLKTPVASSPKAFDCYLRRKDGGKYRAEVRLFPTWEKHKTLYVFIINDLSLKESTRKVLDQRESDFQALVSNIPGMAYQVHCTPNGKLTLPFVSANSRMLLGVKPQKLQANPGLLLDMIIPEDLPSYQAALAEANHCHLSFNWEGRIWIEAWKDIKWISIRTSRRETPDGTLWDGIMLNITQSRLAKEELERSKEQLRKLAWHIEHAKEEERKHIAQEIHDELGGNLTAIKIGLSWLARNADKDITKCIERLKYVDNVVDNTLDAIHRISNDLRPPVLDFGIVSAIRWQIEQLCRDAGIDCQLLTKLEHIPLDDETSIAVFRIVQESLTNIVKHAQASRVEIALNLERNRLQLEISDNGIGPKPGRAKSRTRSFGVIGMTERASALGGRFSIEPRPSGGTIVKLELPMIASAAAEKNVTDRPKANRTRKPLKSKQGLDV